MGKRAPWKRMGKREMESRGKQTKARQCCVSAARCGQVWAVLLMSVLSIVLCVLCARTQNMDLLWRKSGVCRRRANVQF